MSESTQLESTTAAAEVLVTLAEAIDHLREAGGQQVDAVRFHYLETLATRVSEQQGRVRKLLEVKLAAAIEEFKTRLPKDDLNAQAPVACVSVESAKVGHSALAELTQYLGTHALNNLPIAERSLQPVRQELKSVRQFRNTWSMLSADQQLKRALNQAPKNAGPINSHGLVLRSLTLMRDISPDYLNRFMSYADALLCLDQPAKEPPPSSVKAAASAGIKKARSPRAKAASQKQTP